MEYGIRLREKAIPVSYLHPAIDGALLRERKAFCVSEWVDLGDPFRRCFPGEGERASKDNLRARRSGVVGSELDCGLGMRGICVEAR